MYQISAVGMLHQQYLPPDAVSYGDRVGFIFFSLTPFDGFLRRSFPDRIQVSRMISRFSRAMIRFSSREM